MGESRLLPEQLLAAATVEDETDRLILKVLRRIIPFCILCFLLNYVDRANIAIAKSSMIATISGFTDNAYSIGVAVFFIPYCLFEVPSNLIQQRVGARRWIARIMITWGMISTCFMFTRGPRTYYILRALLGLALAAVAPRLAGGMTGTLLTVAGLSLTAIGWFASFAVFWAIPPQLLTGTAIAASLAIINALGNLLGNFLNPNLRVWLALNRPTFLLVAAGCGLMAAVLLPLLRLPKRDQASPTGFPDLAES